MSDKNDTASSRPVLNLSFTQAPTLTVMFGTEDKLQAMFIEEIAALATTTTIVNFLKEKAIELAKAAGGKALEWATAQLLKAIGLGGGPSELEQIESLLKQVLENQRQILQKLEELLREVQFQHLVTRGYDSVERIINMYERMQRLSNVSNPDELKREAEVLKSGILDPNLGTMLNLKTISDVMLGNDQLGKSDALINLFVDRWFPIYTTKQLHEDVPLSTYAEQLEAWLHGVAVIQFMGLTQLANARIRNGDFELLKQEIEEVVKQIEQQQALLAKSIPAWTKTLPTTLFDGRWYVVRGRDLQGGRIDNSQVMYGSPAGGVGFLLDYSVQFRDRHNNNGDEEWQFKKANQNDIFYMVERSRPNYVQIDQSNNTSVRVGPQSKLKLRFIMAKTNDPNVSKTGTISELYVPVIGCVGRSDYLTWTRGGSNVVLTGPIDKAVRVQIEYAGH